MVPEVLLALLGVPGEVIVLVPGTATSPERFGVSTDLDILEPPERVSLDRLVQIGYAFRELERFVHREYETSALSAVGASNAGPRRGNNGSLYRNALASGVNSVLEKYESVILRLEQDILRGAVPALPAALESALSEYALLLPSIWSTTIEPIASSDMKGAQLLHHLHACALSAGAPDVEQAMRALCARTSRAAYQQLLAWTVHGRLVDPHREFWVVPVRGAGVGGGVWLGEEEFGDGANSHDSSEDFMNESDSDSDTSETSYGYFNGIHNSGKNRLRDGGEHEWHRGFQVSLEALPPGVELQIAESVLFTGRAVRILSKPRGFSRGNFQRDSLSIRQSLLPDTVSKTATRLIREFASGDSQFDRHSFEHVVEQIKRPVADRLGQLVVKDANLRKHLTGLRSYFLLGKGDFYQTFLEDAHSLFASAPRVSTAEADLLLPFREAANKSSASDDDMHRRFRPRLFLDGYDKGLNNELNDKESTSTRIPKYDGWDVLSLEYTVPWPLGLVLTKDSMRRYNQMFKYLLRLKRAANALDKAWVVLRRIGNSRSTTTPGALRAEEEREQRRVRMSGRSANSEYPSTSGTSTGSRAHEACQRARRDIAFLVNNWLVYLQTDVVEAQFVEMMGKLEDMTHGAGLGVPDSSKNGDSDDDNDSDSNNSGHYDFDHAVRLHRTFLANLGAQSFLDLPGVSQSVEATLSLSKTICQVVDNLEGDEGVFSSHEQEDTVVAKVEKLAELFAEVSQELYDMLKSDRLANDPKAPYLRRLLLRLNFNDFVGSNAVKKGKGSTKGSGSGVVGEYSAVPSIAPSDLGHLSVRSSVTSLGGWANASDPPTPKRW